MTESGPLDRKLAAILSADVFGYSRLMGADEEDAFRRLTASREVIFRQIDAHQGRVANTAGDAVLAEFGSVRNAVTAAVEIQDSVARLNEAVAEERRMWFRIGINLGDVIERGGDIFGDGVNIAARLQSLADPGGICLSDAVYEQARRSGDLSFAYCGEQAVKNIAEPIKVYKVVTGARPVAQGGAVAVPKWRADAAAEPGGYVVAALPFDNLGDDPSQGYFADGLTEDLITGLAAVEGLRIPARNTMFTYKGKAVDVRVLGKELGATHVVEGSVRKAGTRVRINVQLIDASNGNHLWARRYDKEVADLFAVQDDIVHGIVTELDVRLVHGEQAREWRRSTKSAEAYDLFWQAADIRYRNAAWTEENFARALALNESALAADPQFVAALVQRAGLLMTAAAYGISPDPHAAFSASLALLEKAISLDANAAAAHAMRGFALIMTPGRAEEGVAEVERSLALNPLLPDVTYAAAWMWISRGTFDKGLAYARRSQELWRGSPNGFYVSAEIVSLIGLQRLEEAEAVARRALEGGVPRRYLALHLTAVDAALGKTEEAFTILRDVGASEAGFNLWGAVGMYTRGNASIGQWYVKQLRSLGLSNPQEAGETAPA